MVAGYRECVDCGLKESEVYDYSLHKYVWVKGQLISKEEMEITFVFAGSESAFAEVVQNTLKEIPKMKLLHMQHPADFAFIDGLRQPQIALGVDWMESPLIYDYRFKLLMEVGHL